MVSNLEKLSSALQTANNPAKDEARRLVEKIKSDPQIQQELASNGLARVHDDAGRGFVVRRRVPEVATTGH